MARRSTKRRRPAALTFVVLALTPPMLVGGLLPARPAQALEDLADYVFVANRTLEVSDPGYMAFNRRGNLLFVGSRSHGQVFMLDLPGAKLAKEIDLGTNGTGVTYLTRTPGALLSFALHGESGVVSVIDLMAQSYLGALRVPGPAKRAFPTADS